jgi:membrane-associated protease RseP (regulator of RpoE activity)
MVLTLLLYATPVAHAGEEPKSFSVPFDTIKTQHMVVEVKINDKGPYRLIFDTGAPDSLVNNRLAKEAGVFPKDFKKPPFALFGAVGQFKIKKLEAGDLTAENLSVMVVDHPTVAAISDVVGPIDGIVGFTFFARYKMTIDYQKKVMTFTPTDYRPSDTMKLLMEKMLMSRADRERPKVLAPAALFGFRVEKDAKDDAAGVVVKEVMPETPAAAAGLKAGDRLLTLDGRWTDTIADTFLAASLVRPGSDLSASVLRDGKEIKLKIKANAGL